MVLPLRHWEKEQLAIVKHAGWVISSDHRGRGATDMSRAPLDVESDHVDEADFADGPTSVLEEPDEV